MPLGEGWATGSGLLENENVWIQQAQFAFDSDYNKGQSVCLVMQVQCDDGRMEKLLLPVGDGWEPGPGGQEVRREDGNTTRPIQKQSAYGQWIESVKAVAETDANLMAALEQRTGGVKQAGTWLGLGFHVIRHDETFKMRDRSTQELIERTTSRLLADQFLGVIGQAPPAAPAAPVAAPVAPPAAPAAAPQPSGVAPVAAPGAPPVIGPPAAVGPVQAPVAPPAAAPAAVGGQAAVATAAPEVIQALTAIAKSAPDHNTWMIQAFGVPGVMGNGALEQGITDQSDAGLFIRLRAS